MDFLKKNYEKVLLGLVLLGLTLALASLPVIISRTRAKLEAAANSRLNTKPLPLPPVDVKLEEAALQRVQAAYALDFTSKHNLFNPVTWQKASDGHLIKIQSGNEIGAGALVISDIKPLYLKLTYSNTNANGYIITVDKDTAASASDRHKTAFVSRETKSGLLALRDVKGNPEKPELQLELNETGEAIILSADKPFKRVDGYAVDLKYPPEAGWVRNNQRVGATLNFAGGSYNIVAITQSNVIVSAKSNDKKTTITFNSPTEPR